MLLCLVCNSATVSELNEGHTFWLDNRVVQIDEGTQNLASMGYEVGDN